MKHRTTQLGQRQNPDSPRVHGLRIGGDSFSVRSQGAVENLDRNETSSPVAPAIERRSRPSLVQLRAATPTEDANERPTSPPNPVKRSEPTAMERPTARMA